MLERGVLRASAGSSVGSARPSPASLAAARTKGAPRRSAIPRMISTIDSSAAPHTTGTPGFTIPAFSAAICASVSPRISVWSSPIEVMTLTSGASTLVQSSRPPSPTSTTAHSTSRAAK